MFGPDVGIRSIIRRNVKKNGRDQAENILSHFHVRVDGTHKFSEEKMNSEWVNKT